MPQRSMRHFFFAFALPFIAAGCAERIATFGVIRPAELNASSGNTMTVGQIATHGHPEASQQISSDLQDRIAHSLNPSVRLLSEGGNVRISGAIVRDDAHESSVHVSSTCFQMTPTAQDANGNLQWVPMPYDCSHWQRVVDLSVAVELTVNDTTRNVVVFDRTYTGGERLTNPSAARVQQRLYALRADAVSDFARVILPWSATVRERFATCGRDPSCAQGFDSVRHGDLATAETLFSRAIGSYETAESVVPNAEVRRVGDALYDRGVTRAYRWDFEDAISDLTRAIALRPNEMAWQGVLYRVRQMQSDVAALRTQWST